MRADSGGEAFVDAATWDAIQPKGRTQEEERRAGGRKPNNPDRYPLSTRIIDLTDGCGSALHGRKSGERLIYRCGRYVNSGGAECHHNTVDADAMLKLVLDALVECVTKAGGEAPDEEHAALPQLRRRIEELDQDLGTARQRMAKEKDDARYEALAHAFEEIRAERDQAAHRVEELTKRPAVVTVAVSPEEKVDALMLAIDELAAVTVDETARQRIRPLVLQLGIWIGLDFEGYTRGKRPLRRTPGRYRLWAGEPAGPRPRGPACRCGGGGARCPTSAPVGDPADPPVGSHRRRARHGGPRRSRRVARHATRQSGRPGVLPGPVGRTRCRRRRWHR